MLSLTHTIVSLPLAYLLGNPASIFLAAFVWHVFCDTLLHWNIYPQQWRRYPVILVALDILAGLFVAWFILADEFLSIPVLAAIAGGNMPDVLHGFWDMLSLRQRKSMPPVIQAAFIIHERSQLETNNSAAGLVVQTLLIVLSLIAVLIFRI